MSFIALPKGQVPQKANGFMAMLINANNQI